MAHDISMLSVAAARRIDAACDRFEEALQSGRECCWQEFLEPFELADQPALLRQLLLLEWEYRQTSGQPLDLSEYIDRFPDHATLIREAGEDHTIESGAGIEPSAGLSDDAQREWEALGYTILRPLGRGGMGTVYLAFQSTTDRLVAIKVLNHFSENESAALNRFRREARLLARLEHPHIVPLFDVGEHQGRPFYSMEYCPAGSLAEHLRHTQLHPYAAAALVETLARAAHAAHQAGIVHRDLKPSNVLLSAVCGVSNAESEPAAPASFGTPISAVPTAKLADFGLARKADATAQTHTGAVLGTPQYMAPEQARGDGKQIAAATDVYGLGAILYECLTGRPPFSGATPLETMFAVIAEEAPPPTRFRHRIPRDLETICLKCLSKSPSQRYENAAALADDLQRFQSGRSIRARRTSPARRTWHWLLRHPVAASLLAAVLTASAISLPLAGWALGERNHAADVQRELKYQAARRNLDQALSVEQLEGPTGVLLRLAASLKEAVDAKDNILEEAIRRQLAFWSRDLTRRSKVFAGHEGSVFAVAYSTEGTKMVTGSADHTARLWDVATGQWIEPPLVHKNTVFAVAFSPDGEHVLTGSADGTAQLWKTATGQRFGPPLEHDNRVLAVAFSPDGTKILTGSDDKTTKLWNAATGKLIRTMVHSNIVRAVAFSPDGNTIVTGCDDKTARMWQTATGAPVAWQVRHDDRVFAVAFSPDGKLVLTGSQDRTAQLWDTATGSPIGPPRIHLDTVFAVDFSLDGSMLLTASDDGSARLWDAGGALPVGRLQHRNRVRAAVFSPDGRKVLTGSWERIARQWEVDVPTIFEHQTTVQIAAFSPDGETVLTASGDQTARLWDKRGAPIGQVMQHDAWVGTAVFSPDGNFVLTGCADKTARLWNARTGHAVGSPLLHDGPVWRVAFSPNGKSFVTASKDGFARLWSTATRELLCPPMKHHGPVFTVIFSPDGNTILTGGLDRFARLWDAASGKLLAAPLEHKSGVGAVAFSPDGTKVLTGSDDKTAKLWDATSGRPLGQALQHRSSVDVVAFSQDGKTIVTGSQDKSAQLWDVTTQQPLYPPLRHQGTVAAAAFSRDSKILLTASDEDSMARLWDISTGTRLGLPLPHPGGIVAVAFDSNGESILTGSQDGTARLWEVPAAMEGDPEQITLWLQAATGMRLDDRGGLETIDSQTRNQLRQPLTRADGSPLQQENRPRAEQ